MTLHPRHHKDLMLAPVAAEIDLNLQRIRDSSSRDVVARLELELDRPAMCTERDARAELVLRQALRGVELHGWTAAITDDGARLRLGGGSVSLELGLSAGIMSYIQAGVTDAWRPLTEIR
jgi:acetyl-CoA acetyltransferase